jgi:hypothetical protein
MQWHTHILRRRRSCVVDLGDRMKRYVVPGLVLVMPGSSKCIFGWFANEMVGSTMRHASRVIPTLPGTPLEFGGRKTIPKPCDAGPRGGRSALSTCHWDVAH